MSKSKIKKIIFEDGKSLEYKDKTREDFNDLYIDPRESRWYFNNQYKNYEESILSTLNLDIEEYAKEQYNLIPESEQKTVDDFDDDDIEGEYISRGLGVNEYIKNENIINISFTARLAEIVNCGNDIEIDAALEVLEKKYRIK